jgi:hypothetical protein
VLTAHAYTRRPHRDRPARVDGSGRKNASIALRAAVLQRELVRVVVLIFGVDRVLLNEVRERSRIDREYRFARSAAVTLR